MAFTLARIVAHNENVFAPYYRGLLITLRKQLLPEAAGARSSEAQS